MIELRLSKYLLTIFISCLCICNGLNITQDFIFLDNVFVDDSLTSEYLINKLDERLGKVIENDQNLFSLYKINSAMEELLSHKSSYLQKLSSLLNITISENFTKLERLRDRSDNDIDKDLKNIKFLLGLDIKLATNTSQTIQTLIKDKILTMDDEKVVKGILFYFFFEVYLTKAYIDTAISNLSLSSKFLRKEKVSVKNLRELKNFYITKKEQFNYNRTDIEVSFFNITSYFVQKLVDSEEMILEPRSIAFKFSNMCAKFDKIPSEKWSERHSIVIHFTMTSKANTQEFYFFSKNFKKLCQTKVGETIDDDSFKIFTPTENNLISYRAKLHSDNLYDLLNFDFSLIENEQVKFRTNLIPLKSGKGFEVFQNKDMPDSVLTRTGHNIFGGKSDNLVIENNEDLALRIYLVSDWFKE